MSILCRFLHIEAQLPYLELVEYMETRALQFHKFEKLNPSLLKTAVSDLNRLLHFLTTIHNVINSNVVERLSLEDRFLFGIYVYICACRISILPSRGRYLFLIVIILFFYSNDLHHHSTHYMI
jgi:hypothetical protein